MGRFLEGNCAKLPFLYFPLFLQGVQWVCPPAGCSAGCGPHWWLAVLVGYRVLLPEQLTLFP